MEELEIVPKRYELSDYGEVLLDIARQVFTCAEGDYSVIIKSDAKLCAEVTQKLREVTGKPVALTPSNFKRALTAYMSDDMVDFMEREPFLFAVVTIYHEAVYEIEASILSSLIGSKTHVDLQKYQFLLSRAPRFKVNWAERRMAEMEEEAQAKSPLAGLSIIIPQGTVVITSEQEILRRYDGDKIEDANIEATV